jgi:hypothetical protein
MFSRMQDNKSFRSDNDRRDTPAGMRQTACLGEVWSEVPQCAGFLRENPPESQTAPREGAISVEALRCRIGRQGWYVYSKEAYGAIWSFQELTMISAILQRWPNLTNKQLRFRFRLMIH